MRVIAAALMLAAPACAQTPAPQLQARYNALVERQAQGHAPAAYERQWMEDFLAGAAEATAPWQWVYTQRTQAEELHRNGGSHLAIYYETWTVTDDRAIAPADWVPVGEACGRPWFGPSLMGRMGDGSGLTRRAEITIQGPGAAICAETWEPPTMEDWVFGWSVNDPGTDDPERP